MKKFISILTISAFVFALSVAPTLATIDNTYGLDYGTITGLGTNDLRTGIMGIVNVLLGFLGIIAIIIILWGGFRWLTSTGNEEKVAEARKIITAGIIGLIIVFTAYAIAAFVINQLITATGAA